MKKLSQVGYRLLSENEIEAAISIFEYLVECYPDSAEALDSLGKACTLAGDFERATQCYRRALELNPEDTQAKTALKKLEAD